MLNLNSKIRFSNSLFIQDIDDERVILDEDTGLYFGLDSVSKEIWELLSIGYTISQVVDELEKIYDIDREQLSNDVVSFISSLIDNNLAEEL